MTRLYHYTCADHGLRGIERERLVRPGPPHPVFGHLAWFTDLPTIDAFALGLTRDTLSCDRTAYRFEVALEGTTWWPLYRQGRFDRAFLADFESMGKPLHWWVATEPVRIISGPEATT